MIRTVLAHAEAMIPFFAPFPKLALKFLKGLLKIWATSEEDARIDAFLRIRELAVTMPTKDNLLESALRGIYLSYVRNSGFVSAQSLPTILFMAHSVVELFSLEPVSSYQYAFIYIRQLAIHLRNAITSKTKDAHKGYCYDRTAKARA